MANESEAARGPGSTPADDAWSRKRVAESLIKRHAALAAGVSLAPAPGFDALCVSGITLNLINRLSNLYGVAFSRQAGLNVIVTLLSGSLDLAFRTTVFSVLKVIPIVGAVAGTATMPLLGGSIVYAIGQVMIRHYEAGGDLLSFDAHKAKEYFRSQVADVTVEQHPVP